MSGLNFTKKKIINVGVTITTEGIMEVVKVDPATKMVKDYRAVPVDYNFQTKEISDYAVFGSSLRSILFDDLGLNHKNINLTITIPSVHFATAQIPSTQADSSSVSSILATYAQDSYLFKRQEPSIAYQVYTSNNKNTTPLIYSAIQESVINQLKEEIVNNVGIDNFSINNPYASIINALDYCGKIQKQVNSNEVWNFVQITNNGFTLFSMIGTKIIEVNDMPLPLKTFAPEEIYESMALSLQNNLSIYPASSLFVLSRTDLLSAQILLQNMDLRGDVDYLENNKFRVESFIDVDPSIDVDIARKISIEVVGSAITNNSSPIHLCYFSNKDEEDEVYGYVNLFGQEVTVNNNFISKVLIAAAVVVVLLGSFLYFTSSTINKYYEKEISKHEEEKAKIISQIREAEGNSEGNVENIIADISKNNESIVDYFEAISTEIPSNLWLTYFYADSAGALGIKGDTADVSGIYSFFKSIKKAVPGSSINLSKLEYNDINALLIDDMSSNKSINFEISNSAYSKVVRMMASQPGEGVIKTPVTPANEARRGRPVQPKKQQETPPLPELPEIDPPTN